MPPRIAATSETAVDTKNCISVVGIIKKQGITPYQYGSHVIIDKSGVTLSALMSNEVNLDDYIGFTAAIKGHNIIGYPVENGPKYLNVQNISIIKQ